MKKPLYVVAGLFTLTGCQQTPAVDKATVDDLRTRIRALEQGQQELTEEVRRNVKAAEDAPRAIQTPIATPMTYELIGAGSTRRTYPSEARCEAAKAAMQNARDEETAGSSGTPSVIYAHALNCIPL